MVLQSQRGGERELWGRVCETRLEEIVNIEPWGIITRDTACPSDHFARVKQRFKKFKSFLRVRSVGADGQRGGRGKDRPRDMKGLMCHCRRLGQVIG